MLLNNNLCGILVLYVSSEESGLEGHAGTPLCCSVN